MSRERETDSLEEIGSQFQTIRLKFGVERRTNKFDTVPEAVPRVSLDMVESWTGDVIENREEEPQASAGLVKFHEGDVCFSKLRPYLAKAFEAEYFGAASPEFLVFEPTQFEPRFLRYLVLSREFIERVDASTYGAKMPRASWNFIGSLRVPCPDKREQHEIATFLDRRTARIDALVAKQKRLLDLLSEKRQALITQAVTKGLDSTVATKNTGVEWLGEIPEHWEFVRLKFLLYEIEQGWSPQCEDRPTGPDEWGVLKAGCMNNMDFRPEEHKRLPDDLNPRRELEIEQGDVLMSRANTRELVGSCGRVDEPVSKLLLCDKLYRLDLREFAYNSDFFVYVANSDPSRKQIEIDASGASSSMVNISQEFVKEMYVPLPPQDEQEEIAQYLDEKLARVCTLKASVRTGIDLLSEKRQALITAAVTGQIDVTEGRGEIQEESV